MHLHNLVKNKNQITFKTQNSSKSHLKTTILVYHYIGKVSRIGVLGSLHKLLLSRVWESFPI